MQTGVCFRAYPTSAQSQALSRWIRCARVIWNAKCEEHRYLSSYARKYHPIGTYAPIDQTYAQFKSKDLTPWLSECPSQVLRNSAVNWYRTIQKALKKHCGWPKLKKRSSRESVHLTRELFRFETGKDGTVRLFIGTERNNLGELSFKAHRSMARRRSRKDATAHLRSSRPSASGSRATPIPTTSPPQWWSAKI